MNLERILKTVRDGYIFRIKFLDEKMKYEIEHNIRNVIEAVESINKHGLHPDLIEIGNKGLIEAAELYNDPATTVSQTRRAQEGACS